jgi:phosphoribosylaminoimidazole-succinocarboxamide synthase
MSPVSSTAGSFVRSGKVRDLYAIGEDRLLLVASDRLSAFDVVLPTEIPDKGRVLTGLSRFWFSRTESIVPNHLLAAAPEDLPAEMAWDQDASRELRGRMMLCRRADVLPIEVLVRGYITGSGWKDYLRTGAVCGIALPAGLKESERLPEPLFTPSTKAEVGHDENIDLAEAARLVGADMALRVRDVAIELYKFGSAVAEPAGIILADTKFEFGRDAAGTITLIDEVLTPDSSRYWPAEEWRPGASPPSFDKQIIRDWLEASGWNKEPPPPALPGDVIDRTAARYEEILVRLTK